MIAFVSPLGHVGEELLWVHMVQHLVIGDIAALLIVLGLTRSILAPVLAIRFFDRLRVLGLPYIALPLWIANLFIWHIPVLYEGAVNNSALHAPRARLLHRLRDRLVDAGRRSAAGAALVRRRRPGRLHGRRSARRRRCSATSSCGRARCSTPSTSAGDRFWGISPITDQGIAGIVMLIESGIVTLAVLAWAMLRWAARDAEKQRLLDLADSLGVPLDDARADRAVAAGHGARLEERLRGS